MHLYYYYYFCKNNQPFFTLILAPISMLMSLEMTITFIYWIMVLFISFIIYLIILRTQTCIKLHFHFKITPMFPTMFKLRKIPKL